MADYHVKLDLALSDVLISEEIKSVIRRVNAKGLLPTDQHFKILKLPANKTSCYRLAQYGTLSARITLVENLRGDEALVLVSESPKEVLLSAISNARELERALVRHRRLPRAGAARRPASSTHRRSG
jgi:hypothetical protein